MLILAATSIFATFYHLAQILKPFCAGLFMTFATAGGLFLLAGWGHQAHKYAQGYTAQSLLGTFGTVGFPLALILAWGNAGGIGLIPGGLAPPDGALDLAFRSLALRLPHNALAALESMSGRMWAEWGIGGLEFLAHPVDSLFGFFCYFAAKFAAWIMELVVGIRILLMSIAWAFGPLYICALAAPATRSIGTTFLLGALSVYMWPLAFGFVDAGTIALLSAIVGHSLGFYSEIFAMFTVGLWVLIGYIAAPFALGVAMTSGNVVGAAGTLIGAAMGGAAAGMGAMAQKTLGAAGAAANMIPGVGPALGAGLSGLGNMAGSAGRHTGAAMQQGAHGQVYHPSFTRGGMSFGGGRGRPPTPTDGGNRPPSGNGGGTPPNNPPDGGGGGDGPPPPPTPPPGGGPKPPPPGQVGPNIGSANFTGGVGAPPPGNRPIRHARSPQMNPFAPTSEPPPAQANSVAGPGNPITAAPSSPAAEQGGSPGGSPPPRPAANSVSHSPPISSSASAFPPPTTGSSTPASQGPPPSSIPGASAGNGASAITGSPSAGPQGYGIAPSSPPAPLVTPNVSVPSANNPVPPPPTAATAPPPAPVSDTVSAPPPPAPESSQRASIAHGFPSVRKPRPSVTPPPNQPPPQQNI